MKCNQCGKEIPKTNQFRINYNNESIVVCGKHYAQFLKHKHFLDNNQRTCFNQNEIEVTEEGVWIYTFNRQQEPSGKFLIDKEDLEKVLIKKWRYWKGNYYTGNYKPISIWRYLINPKENQVVDHINGNRADNRKTNLRLCTQHENSFNRTLSKQNKSGVAGVWFDKERNKWASEIKFNSKKCFLGRYKSLEDAVFVRYYAETKIFKDFRNTRNDKRILSIITTCGRKEELIKNVNERLQKKFNSFAN